MSTGTAFILFMAIGLGLWACGSGTRHIAKGDVYEVEFPDSITKQQKDSLNVVEKDPVSDSLDSLYPQILKPSYNIAYLLPFYARNYPNLSAGSKTASEIATRYWWGAKLALDTLKDIGISLNVKAYDTENDTAKITSLKSKIEDDSTDLILGPLFSKNVRAIAPFAAEKRINLVSPISNIANGENSSEFVHFSSPSPSYRLEKQVELLADSIGKKYPIYLFYRPIPKELKLAKELISALPDGFDSLVVRAEIDGRIVKRESYRNKFEDTCVIFILSDQESFVSSALAEVQRSLKQFHVFGREKWLSYESLNAETWEKMRMTFFISFSIDTDNELTKRFIRKYREAYYDEPDEYAFRGFSETMFYGTHLFYFGKYFQRQYGTLNYKLPCLEFAMKQAEGSKYFSNQHLYLFHFKDREFIEYSSSKNGHQDKSAKGDH